MRRVWPKLLILLAALPVAWVSASRLFQLSVTGQEADAGFLVVFVALPLVSATLYGYALYAGRRGLAGRGVALAFAALALAPATAITYLILIIGLFFGFPGAVFM